MKRPWGDRSCSDRGIERGGSPESVDSLHLRAGSSDPIELHGNLREARCDRCGERRPLDAAGLPIEEIDHACGGRMRPDIVWFGEALPRAAWERAEAAAALATHYNRFAYVAEINPEETAISGGVDCVLRGTAAETLPKIVESLAE